VSFDSGSLDVKARPMIPEVSPVPSSTHSLDLLFEEVRSFLEEEAMDFEFEDAVEWPSEIEDPADVFRDAEEALASASRDEISQLVDDILGNLTDDGGSKRRDSADDSGSSKVSTLVEPPENEGHVEVDAAEEEGVLFDSEPVSLELMDVTLDSSESSGNHGEGSGPGIEQTTQRTKPQRKVSFHEQVTAINVDLYSKYGNSDSESEDEEGGRSKAKAKWGWLKKMVGSSSTTRTTIATSGSPILVQSGSGFIALADLRAAQETRTSSPTSPKAGSTFSGWFSKK